MKTKKKEAVKRSSEHLSPTNDVQKRYTWDYEKLLAQNMYYLPDNLQPSDNELPSTSGNTNTTGNTNKLKIPPIYLYEVKNHTEIITDLNKLIENQDYTTKFSSNFLKINLNSENDYRKVTKFYKDNKIQYHTYQNGKDRPVSVVLKNVPISLTNEEISQELEKYNLPIIRVTRLTNKEKKPMPICAVDLTNNETAADIYKVKEVYKSIITIEPRRNNINNRPQCHRCQRIGHTKNYCTLQPRCVKCSGNHLYTECTKTNDTPPTCVNCREPHPANYRGCSYIKRLNTSNNNEFQRTTYTPNVIPPVTRTTPPKTYSSAVRNNQYSAHRSENDNNNAQQDTPYPWLNQILHAIKNLLEPYIEQIKNFITSQIMPCLFSVR